LAMLTDIKLVTLHSAPVALGRSVPLAAKPLDPTNSVKRELITIDFIQNDHIEGRCRRSFIAKSSHVDIVVIPSLVG
jgi:hypothetical protein